MKALEPACCTNGNCFMGAVQVKVRLPHDCLVCGFTLKTTAAAWDIALGGVGLGDVGAESLGRIFGKRR